MITCNSLSDEIMQSYDVLLVSPHSVQLYGGGLGVPLFCRLFIIGAKLETWTWHLPDRAPLQHAQDVRSRRTRSS